MSNARTKSEIKLLEPTKVQPALPLPKRPSSKAEPVKKPPAPNPEELHDTRLQKYQITEPLISSSSNTVPVQNTAISSPTPISFNNKISSASQFPVTKMVFSQPGPIHFPSHETSTLSQKPKKASPITESPLLMSPTHGGSIPGNHSTNPFIDLISPSDKSDKQNFVKDLQSLSITQIFHKKPSGNSTSVSSPEQRTNKNVLTTTNDQNLIQSLPVPAQPAPKPPQGPPIVPERPKHTLGLESTKLWQLSPRALIDPPKVVSKECTSSSSQHSETLYRAVFDFNSTQHDELSLKKGDFYLVTEQCHDGWFKGKSVKTGKSGVFPGNHVQEHDSKSVSIAFK